MNKVKVKESKIDGLGLFADQEFNEGDMIGLAHYNGVPSEIIGKYHNHSDNPNAHSVVIGNKRYLAALRPLKKGEEITVDYRQQPDLEQPEEFRKGGLVSMPKPSKKGLASKRYSRDLTATNRLLTKNKLLQKPKSKKNKIYDPNAKYYQDGGIVELDGYRFKKDASGNWTYESGAPVTDRGMIQRLTYEAKPVGSPVVQSRPKPSLDKPVSPYTTINKLKNSPVLADQEKVKQAESQALEELVYNPIVPNIRSKEDFPNDVEGIIDEALNFPGARARIAAKAAAGPGEDPIDPFRHSNAARYAAESIKDYVADVPYQSIPFIGSTVDEYMDNYVAPGLGFLGANLLGLAHEASVFVRDKRPVDIKYRESFEDMYNNYVGAKTGASNMSPEAKTNYLLYLSSTNRLPDGVVSKPGSNKNLYIKSGPNDPGKYKSSYQDGGIVQLDGYRFKKDDSGNWFYESGAPVTDRALVQRLTYESKPVGSSVVQNAPRPRINQAVWENAAGTSQQNAIAREKQLQALKASPVLADKEMAAQIEWQRSQAAAAQKAEQEAKWRNEQPLDMMDWLWGAAAIGPTIAPAAWAAAETAGTAAMPYINAAFNTIPGQLVSSGLAADAIVNRLYPSAGKIQEGRYGEAAEDIATGILDLAGANMISPLYKGAKATASELAKFIDTGVPRELPGSPNSTSEIQKAGFIDFKGMFQKYPKGPFTPEEIERYKETPFFKQTTSQHNEDVKKYGDSWPLPNFAEEALKEGKRHVVNPQLYGGDNYGIPDYIMTTMVPGAVLGTAGLYGLVFSPPAVRSRALRSLGVTGVPGGLSDSDTTINLTNAPMDYAKVNQFKDGRIIIGGEFIEEANNTVRKAKDWKNATDTYSDRLYPSNKIESFYGVEDGKFKVGKASDFKPDTEIVPRRFGAVNIKKAVLNGDEMRLLDEKNKPIYQNTPNTGKFILYSPSTGKSQFNYINTGKSGVNKVNRFLKQNKDAQYIHLDNGRYEFYGVNEPGLTNQDFINYYQQDLERKGNPGYNLIIKKDGGEPKGKKKKRDSKGRYRGDKDYIHTPFTEEWKQTYPAGEWGQTIQEIPEVYVLGNAERVARDKARAAEEEIARLNYQRYLSAPHMYLPDGSLRPQAAQSADWVWQLGLGAKPSIEGLNALAAKQIGKTGITYGTAANTAFGVHGATQVPQVIESWQDVASGEKDWKEAALESGLTALELYGGYGALKELSNVSKTPSMLPGSPNNTIMKSGMLNPLALADAIVPRLPHPIRIPLMGMSYDGLGPFTGSPLNFLPGYGKDLGKAGNAFRKFGNTMEYVQDTKTLSPKGGSSFRIGRDQIVNEGNWAALNEPWENYPGTFAAQFDFAAPGSNLSYVNPSSRNGVLITDRAQNTLVDIPITDPGLSFHRRLPFSNRYVPINKEKLLNNQFQLATQGGHFQSLVEKYGYGLAYAGLLGAMGYPDAVKNYNKYTIDPVINEAKKILNGENPFVQEEYQKGGGPKGDEPKNKKVRFQPGTYDPNEMAGYMKEEPEVTVSAEASPWGKARGAYKEKNPEEEFIERKKRQYVRQSNKGLNKIFGVSTENFNPDVEQNFRDEYDYLTNTAVVKKVSRQQGWNPNKRKEYVDDLNETQRQIVANSKYGSKLQPNYWDRALAGAATLLSPFSSGIQRMMNEGYMPGLTKDESQAILNSEIFGVPMGGAEIFTPLTLQGQALANYAKNRGLSTGSDYKELPAIGSGESMANVDDTDAMALDLPSLIELGFAPQAGLKLMQGLYKGAKQLPDAIDNFSMFPKQPVPLEGYDLTKGQATKSLLPELVEEPRAISNATEQVQEPWRMQPMSGLHLKSTMTDGPISKIVEPKTGLVNVDQALKIIAKESGGEEKVAMIQQALGENIPKKMDYNQFRKVVQDQLIPLDKTIVSGGEYGVDRIGYELGSPEIKTQKIILSNKDKFGRGSDAHGNPEETLGHIHMLYDAEEPGAAIVTQMQADPFQGTHRSSIRTKEQVEFSLKRMEEHYAKMKDAYENLIKLPDGSYQLPDGQRISESLYKNMFSGQKEAIDLTRAELQNFGQKQLLDKNHQERYLQEIIQYAAERGDINRIKLPTAETSAKIQGYFKQPVGDPDLMKRLRGDIVDAVDSGSAEDIRLAEEAYAKAYADATKNGKLDYSPEQKTILKKYSENPKIIKKLYGIEPKIVTDSKGNTWYEFNIPYEFKEGPSEIKAFNYGGVSSKLNKFIR